MTELRYYDLGEKKEIFPEPVKSAGFMFVPAEGDTLLVDGWGYIVGQREFSYEQSITKITIFCSRERKKRK
ncbi:hypothetical protein JSY36_05635 [Bacillus sp. H-16]|uniref:hypothetical protein n=1 Tax=Alteribacter salitolerans TaxID=2912333 RepID=UPI0019659ED9|nr:hypothetical protein [Alteribacter salitolerans]MBM7095232.1 hypothetical protein [Alteribacter salitolerans]